LPKKTAPDKLVHLAHQVFALAEALRKIRTAGFLAAYLMRRFEAIANAENQKAIEES
jgi:hypothetical protein